MGSRRSSSNQFQTDLRLEASTQHVPTQWNAKITNRRNKQALTEITHLNLNHCFAIGKLAHLRLRDGDTEQRCYPVREIRIGISSEKLDL